ncbi:MAG TPA: hypothetical protein PKK60_04260 [archaeon]|nr:hypothetical protein [archaeon]
MPYKPKGRETKQTIMDAKRKHVRLLGQDGRAILLGARGGITRKKLRQVVERMKQQKEMKTKPMYIEKIESYDRILGERIQVSATDISTRLVRKYLMKPFRKNDLTEHQRKIISSMILQRPNQVIPGTKIPLRPDITVLLLDLLNSYKKNGYEKTRETLQILANRGKALSKMTEKSKTLTDVFHNISPRVHTPIMTLELFSENDLVAEVKSLIPKRVKDLEELKNHRIKFKEIYVKEIEQQILHMKELIIKHRQNQFY